MTGYLLTKVTAVAAVSLLVLVLAGTALALSDNEWDATTCILSYSNPAIHKDGYSVRVIDFDGYGAVHVNISYNDTVIGWAVLKNNDTDWCSADNGKIEIKGLGITDRTKLSGPGRWPDDPKAELTIRTYKEQTPPDITVELDVDGKEYHLDDTVTASITIKNIGETKTCDIHLSIGADGLFSDETCEYKYSSIEGGSSRSETVKFRFPGMLSDNMSVFANATWDNEDRKFGVRETIITKPPLKITKSTTGTGNKNATFYTTIGVTNQQTRNIHAVLADVLPMGFTLIDGSVTDADVVDTHKLLWEFDLDPGEMKTFSYQSVTSRPAVYRVPTPHIKCSLGGLDYTAVPGYSTTITVLQCQLDNEHRNSLPALNTTPNATGSSGGPQVNLRVYILPAVSFEATPTSLDFGTLAPGKTSYGQSLMFNNDCNHSLAKIGGVKNTGDNLFVDGIVLNDSKLNMFDMWSQQKASLMFQPDLMSHMTTTGVGMKKEAITFLAETWQ